MKRLLFLCLIAMLGMLAGCQVPGQTARATVSPSEVPVPNDYLDEYLANQLLHASSGGSVICVHDTLGSEREGDAVELYLWALCEEFYCDQQGLEQGSGVSLPVAVEATRQDSGAWSLAHKTPRDGSDHGQDVSAIFPRRILSKIAPGSAEEITEFNRRVASLQESITMAAQARSMKCQ